jgi:hypothetical protein
MNSYLFRTVVVEGNVHYAEDTPFPVFVEMMDIRSKGKRDAAALCGAA